MDFAFRETGLDPDLKLDHDKIHKIAESLRADSVVSVGYLCRSNIWNLNGDLYIVAKDMTIEIAPVTSSDLQEAVRALNKNVLVALNIRVRPEVELLMERKMTDSAEALRLASEALWSLEEAMSIPSARVKLLKACSLDPDFAVAQCGLADCLKLEGNFDLAKEAATKAVSSQPDSAWALSTLAEINELMGKEDLAERQYRRSIQLDPDAALSYRRLSNSLIKRKRWEEARSMLLKAKDLEPYNAMVHGQLAITYARLGNRKKALMELGFAERYDDGDPGVQQVVAIGYEILNEIPQAIVHYELFLEKIKKAGGKGSVIEGAEKRVQALKARVVSKRHAERRLTGAVAG